MVERPDRPDSERPHRDAPIRKIDPTPRSQASEARESARENTSGLVESRRSAQRSLGRRASQLVTGRLQEHGRARYQFRPDEEVSYYAKLITTAGVRVLWGKDLERAIHAGETQPKTGDLIGARRVRREAVTVVDRTRDAQGNVLTQREQHAHRNRWEVEKLQFFSDRARRARLVRDAHLDSREAVRQRPELRSTFLSLRAAEELARKRIRNPEDRERFLNMVRDAINASVQRGEPLPDLNLRTSRSGSAEHSSAPLRKSKRDDPTRE